MSDDMYGGELPDDGLNEVLDAPSNLQSVRMATIMRFDALTREMAHVERPLYEYESWCAVQRLR